MNPKHLLTLLSLLLCTTLLPAQDFYTNLEEATAMAERENKQVLLVFSGSDWCKPCILLKREVLHSSDFESYARDHLVIVNLDFPYQRRNRLPKDQEAYNAAKAERYNPEGQFPRSLLLDHQGNVLRQLAYKPGMSPEAYLNQLTAEL